MQMFPLKAVFSQVPYCLNMPLTLSLGVELASSLQIIFITLKASFSNDNYDTAPILTFVSDFSSYAGEVNSQSFQDGKLIGTAQTWWIIFSIYFILHILLFLVCLIKGKSLIHQKDNWLFKVLAAAYLVHSKLIFFMAHYFLMSLIGSYNDCQSNSFYCHTGWLSLTIVLCIANICLALVIELSLYQITKGKNTYAVKNNRLHQTVFIHKTLAVLLYFLIGNSTIMAKTSSAVNLILSAIELIILFWKLPFYNLTVLKTSIVAKIILISTSFISLLRACGIDSEATDPIWVALTLLSIRLGLSCFNILSENILRGQFTSPEAAIFFVTKFKHCEFGYISNYLFKDKLEKSTLVARGFLRQQNSHNLVLEENNSGMQDCKVNMYTFILEKLTKILQKNPNSEILILYMARLEMKKLKNIPNTLKYIRKAKGISLCMSAQGAIGDTIRIIKRTSRADTFDDTQDQRSFRGYFKSRKKAVEMQKKMISEVSKHLKFWDDLKKDTVDLKQLVDLAYEIDTTAVQIERKYHEYIADFRRHFISALLMHGVYYAILYEDARNPKKVLQTFVSMAEALSQDHTHFNIYSEDTALLTLSVEKASRGKVLDASASAQLLFGYQESQIIGYNLSIFLPIIVAKDIHNLINKYIDSPNQHFIHDLTKKYAKTQTGEFFEVDIHLQLFHKIEDDVKLLVFFRRTSPDRPLFIVDSHGVIQECSECLKTRFKLKNSDQGRLKLQNLCPDFDDINTACNVQYTNHSALVRKNTMSTENLIRDPKTERDDEADNTERETNGDNANCLPISNYTGSNNLGMTVAPSQKTPTPQEETIKPQQIPVDQSTKSLQGIPVPQEQANEAYQNPMEDRYLNFFGLGTSHNNRHEGRYKVEVQPYELGNEVYKIVILSENREIQAEYDKEKTNFLKSVMDKSEINTTKEAKTNSIKDLESHNPVKLQLKVRKPDNKNVQIKAFGAGTPLFAKQNPNPGNSSIGSSTSGMGHRVKRLRVMFDQQSSYTLLRKAACVLYIIMAVILILGGVNYFVAEAAIGEIETNIRIVDLANLRLASAMRSWQSATRFFLRYAGLRVGGMQTLQNDVYGQSRTMLQTNKNFSKSLSSDIRHDLLMEIYNKNISMWEVNQTEIMNDQLADTFIATNYLAQRMMLVANASDPYSSIIVEEVRYVLNNTGNDYLISSEGIIGDTEDILEASIQDNISVLKYLLVGESLVIFVLCLSIVTVAILILQAHRRLFQALVKIEADHVRNRQQQMQRLKEVLNQNSETNKFKFEALELFDKMKTLQKAKTDKIKSLNLLQEPKLVMRKMILFLARFALVSFIIIQIFIVLFAVSQTQSLAAFDDIDTARSQLSLTARAKYRISEVLCAFYMDMVFRGNSKMLVRNEDTASQMTKTLANLYVLNRDVEASFTENGNYPSNATIKEILYDNICPYVPTETKSYCRNATDFGITGFLRVNQKLLAILSTYIPIYLADPTWNTSNTIMGPYAEASRPCTETVEAGYNFLLTHIMYRAGKYISDFNTQQNALYIALLIAIIISTVIIQFVTFKKFGVLYSGRGKVLKVLSSEMLLESKAISFYLNRRFLNKYR